MTEVELIDAVINTLNHVFISGRDNMDKILASINALEELKIALTPKEMMPKEGEEDG